MAVTVTTVLAGTSRFICDVAATADVDVTTGPIPHGLGAIPLSKIMTPLQIFVLANRPNWAVTTCDGTNVVAGKTANGGSGIGGNQIRVDVSLPHSLVK